MFRTLFRGGAPVVLALLLTLSFTAPVAAAPAEEGPVLAAWGEIWEWVASLWEGEGTDRGLGLDPNGSTSGGDRGPELDPNGLNDEGDRGLGLDPNG